AARLTRGHGGEGGTGRRGRTRIPCPEGRGSSSLPSRTKDYDDFFFRPPDFLPPFFEALGVLAIFAARSFDMPFLRRPSYCFSFLTLARLLGTGPPPSGSSGGSYAHEASGPVDGEALLGLGDDG